tara:strand:- start:641 stop:1039 length:399 start_codon:yes stop_codon:yes gene_type:complete
MSDVKSIFGEFENPNANNEEKVIKDYCNEFVEHHQYFVEILIYENIIDKDNRRTVNSKSLIANAMVMYLMLETLISQSIADYKTQYGNTTFINKLESVMFNLIFVTCREDLASYKHLIDEKHCEEIFLNKCL